MRGRWTARERMREAMASMSMMVMKTRGRVWGNIARMLIMEDGSEESGCELDGKGCLLSPVRDWHGVEKTMLGVEIFRRGRAMGKKRCDRKPLIFSPLSTPSAMIRKFVFVAAVGMLSCTSVSAFSPCTPMKLAGPALPKVKKRAGQVSL
eukprot:752190-Hanusia_phi.AAC.1